MSPRVARRRLKRLESALTPNGVVLRWLAEAKAHGSMVAYFEALAAGPGGQSPYERFLELLEPAFDALVPPGSNAEVQQAGVLAVRQADFRFFLITRLNLYAAERVPLLMATAITNSELLDALRAGPADSKASGDADPARDGRWQAWLERAEWLLGEMYTDDIARVIIEECYLGGIGSLFPDVAERALLALSLSKVTTELGLDAHPAQGSDPLAAFRETALERILATAVVQAGYRVTALVERAKSDLYAQYGRALLEQRRQASGASTPRSARGAAESEPIDCPPRTTLDRGRQARSRRRPKRNGLYERVEV